VKHVKVLERVYDPRRLRTAWQQVKHNAGAAGTVASIVDLVNKNWAKSWNLVS
jgi:hypothetical protein